MLNEKPFYKLYTLIIKRKNHTEKLTFLKKIFLKRGGIKMDGYLTSEKKSSNNNINKGKEAQKSLNNYLNQLKFHFELNDDEVLKILESTLKSKNNKNFIKKLWHIWK